MISRDTHISPHTDSAYLLSSSKLGNEKCQTRNFNCYLEGTLKGNLGVIHSRFFMARGKNPTLARGFVYRQVAEAKHLEELGGWDGERSNEYVSGD